ncbi:MAG: RNA degradosome polyphosphate kinase [Actinobacteria bacterium]|uniref:ATP-polyphosphate phosphotransferase n=1 Tax=freshwater metagenome TaxID=449393 RepID=A0A6J5Z150_9ZZZZ|nr:RNA degradosome polyphosphate kinase [Actinomycetota bacterium]
MGGNENATVEHTNLPADRFLDRELSWLAFNQRVLELATDEDLELLERVKYLSIFASNLDEFFMVRVAGLKRRIATGIAVRAASGLLPREVHEAVLAQSYELMKTHAESFTQFVMPELEASGISILRWEDLTQAEREAMSTLFSERVFPVLTPLAVDPSHPFPYISGLSLNLAVVVKHVGTDDELFARVKVPPSLPRFLEVAKDRFVPLEDVIAGHLSMLFPGMEIVQQHAFRVTRNEELEVEEDDAENLLQALERELLRRRFGPPVRLEVENTMDPHVLNLLVSELGVSENEVFRLPGPLDLQSLSELSKLNRDDLKAPAFVPHTSSVLAEVESSTAPDVLEVMRHKDVILHHPYDAFSTSMQLFLEQASQDPNVLAIKQTLYRTSGDSPIVDALINAAELGKQVLAVVELKARFDEQNNIDWARKLEESGVHVVYGLVGLKTHAKLCMVVRSDAGRLRRYVHIGTGNYNPKTARSYEDYGLLTTNPLIGEEVASLFNYLSGYAVQSEYERLIVAPKSMRHDLVDCINREIGHAQAGRDARIRLKCNALVDETIMDALYRASQAGVKVDLLVRGMCSLKPQVSGLSDNIRVRSILGRFLEHSRVYEFSNGGELEVWLGSADLMHRNLDRRVECLVLVGNSDGQTISDTLDIAFSDNTAAWHLRQDGEWERHQFSSDGQPLQDYQEQLIKNHPVARVTDPISNHRSIVGLLNKVTARGR